MEPTRLPPDLHALLRVVYAVFEPTGEWPVHQYVQTKVDCELGSDSDRLLADAPSGLLRVPYPLREDTPIALRVAGLVHCPGSKRDVELFLWALRWCVTKQRSFRPSQPTAPDQLQVSVADMSAALEGDSGETISALDAKKLYALFEGEGLFAGLSGPNDNWTLMLSRAVLKPYFQVQTLEDYLAVSRAASSPSLRPSS